MSLGCNGKQVFARGVQHFGATAFLSAIPNAHHSNFSQTNRIRNLTAGEGITSDLVGLPLGYRNPGAWMMPQKPGALAATNTMKVEILAAGLAVGGITATGTSTITFAIADADGQLIVSGTGAAALAFIVSNLLLTASLNADGETSFTLSTNVPLLGALAGVIGDSTMTINGTMLPYAIGIMSGSTDVGGVLTEASIIAAMNASPPAVNIKKVNDIDVTGDGQTGTEWGPV